MRLQPTPNRQCWLFAAGSALFAVACAPRMAVLAGAGLTHLLCFVGSWFFTTAAWIQLNLSRTRSDTCRPGRLPRFRDPGGALRQSAA